MTGRPRTCTVEGCGGTTVGRRLCRKHYQQAWKAGTLHEHEKRHRTVARTICPPEHAHGATRVCYVHHQCRCDDCRDNNRAMEDRRTRLIAYGRYDTGLVDAAPVREHMLMLAEFGIGYKRVAKLAGFRSSTPARNLIWGRQNPGPRYGELQKRVKRETAEAILAIKPDISVLAGGALVPSRGTHRRVQALVVRGWSQSKIGAAIGMEPGNFGGMMRRDTVLVSTHRAVEALFGRWWDLEPPRESPGDKGAYTRAVNYAKACRWLGPLAWDDIDNDAEPPVPDDVAGVDEVAVELAIAGEAVRLSPAERREAVKRLHASRWSDARIAEALHVADKTVLRIRQELRLAAFEQNDLRDRGAA